MSNTPAPRHLVQFILSSALLLVLSPFAVADDFRFPRPPAIPLVTHDPYFSVWSTTDTLTGGWPRHWTGAAMGISGMARIDGKPFRWCGANAIDVPEMTQNDVAIERTTTTYRFNADGVALTVEFGSPIGLLDDPARASRPVSYVRATATATDGKPHDVSVYLDCSGEWVVNSPEQYVTWSRLRLAGMNAVSIASQDQPVLEKAGDYLRIDWGRLILAAPTPDAGPATYDVAIASHDASRRSFASSGSLPDSDDARMPRAASDAWPVVAGIMSLGNVSGNPVSGHLLLAYDDGLSIELFQRRLKPLWAAADGGIARQITETSKELARTPVGARSEAETALDQQTIKAGGDHYLALTKLAYRQVIAGHKIVADWDNTPLMFSKENSSNGCIGTVDVIYPASPFFLVHSPDLLKAQLLPLLKYAASPRWKFPFAPHDLGTYPKANGQAYGGREDSEENQMPVEESGNMLIMLGALAVLEKNADFSRPFLPILENWAEYLRQHGLDPVNQLCTDDFAGHLARNVNLSAKSIVALGAYAELLRIDARSEDAARWSKVAKAFASQWVVMASDADATLLVFDQPGTWSQKYNLVWDRVLGLDLFPDQVFEREMKLYKTKLQRYGLPLDSRRTYTKLDWTFWSACLTGKRADFDAIIAPVYTWVNETPSRVPLSDWYETTDGKSRGMHARTVVGGIWMPLLMEKMGKGLR